jgi:hypothetical protein
MQVNWRAVAYGFGTALILGIVASVLFPFATVMTPLLMYGLIGGIAGLVAGYYTNEGTGSAVLNGGLSTTIGGVVVLASLILLGLLFEGLVASFGIALVGLLVIVTYAIPGAVGGALGEWYHGRRTQRTPEPAPR